MASGEAGSWVALSFMVTAQPMPAGQAVAKQAILGPYAGADRAPVAVLFLQGQRDERGFGAG